MSRLLDAIISHSDTGCLDPYLGNILSQNGISSAHFNVVYVDVLGNEV